MWTEREPDGTVWLCWYEPLRDPRESRSILNRTLLGRRSDDTRRVNYR
jgi:hypothetical protein